MTGESQTGGGAEFAGGAFDSTLAGGKAQGMVRLTPDGVRFESANGVVALPLDGLAVRLGGANDRFIFFTHPGQPQTTIHTEDRAVLQHPLLAGRKELLAQVARVKSHRRLALAALLLVVLALVAGIVGLVLAKDRLVGAAANAIPVEWEVKLGDTLFDQLKGRSRMLDDPALAARLQQLTGPLVEGIGDAPFPLKFHIIEDATPNAFAMPGGHVVLHTGLLFAADTPEEVAGVLGHEIAHVTRRHGFRGMISSAGLFLLAQAVAGDASGVLAMITDQSAFLLDQKFSRDFEREADDVGWEYLLKANIDPRGMVGFFKKLQAEEEKLTGGSVSGALSLLHTHPATQERIDTLEAKIKTLPGGANHRKFNLNYPDFKAELRGKLHAKPGSGKGGK